MNEAILVFSLVHETEWHNAKFKSAWKEREGGWGFGVQSYYYVAFLKINQIKFAKHPSYFKQLESNWKCPLID